MGENYWLARLRHVDQRDGPASIVFGIKIVTAVVLSCEEPPYRAISQWDVSHYLNFILRHSRRSFRFLIFGVEYRRKCHQSDQ